MPTPRQRTPVDQRHASRSVGVLAFLYIALIVYGSLYPFSDWRMPETGVFDFVSAGLPRYLTRTDILTNVLAYMPLGLVLTLYLRRYVGPKTTLVVTVMSGTLLSFTMEGLQTYLPRRVSSNIDLFTNIGGTLIGALLSGLVDERTLSGRKLNAWRFALFQRGRLADLGLVILAMWALSQLSPLAPSLDIGKLRHGLAPLWNTLHNLALFKPYDASTYVLYITGLGLLARTLAKPGARILALFLAFISLVLLLKIAIISRQLSLEALAGLMAAAIFLPALFTLRTRAAAIGGSLLIFVGFVIAELAPVADAPAWKTQAFNWIPLRDQMVNIIGLADILSDAWPFLAIAYFARLTVPASNRFIVAIAAGAALALAVFGLEWHQQSIPGRNADITDVLIPIFGWVLPWFIHTRSSTAEPQTLPPSPMTFFLPRRSKLIGALAATILAVTTLGGWIVLKTAPQRPTDESTLPRLPEPQALPPVSLARFHYTHPRLPAPSGADIAAIATNNPEFFTSKLSLANSGNLEAAILMARVQPGSQDLRALHKRLMALQYQWRGHEQAKPIALAYDWLYSQWSESERAQLRGKLAQGCEYLIERIRKERLSPYNVYLYNSPFQALMAATLAIYGDDPRAEGYMRFTYDLWKNRVLPVWRQVMGKQGGWHEGGEYIGIGIGQAIYQIPAMWRLATGEDVFASEPGIRGFLDFAVYRTRPDGTHMRWGDAAFFDKEIPDLPALALEYRHAAAYTLQPPSKNLVPTSWPWGPLSDFSLYDDNALARLPLAKSFDGIGMLIARSNWRPDATYVTFKAGDNYWSHSHLDQGAFTIYKGGELAIDSGLYGPKYGSDHHMNYTYQTIAHNTITVTDPNDSVPAPGKKEARTFANDGGQRRIGSGWGVLPAPLDLSEWMQQRDIYHTASFKKLLLEDGLNVAVASITPAYTNRDSGSGTFSGRTRRVEQFWRTFAYDQVDDVIVIFDQVKASKSAFRKRWLLHTLERPQVTPGGFIVTLPNSGSPARQGGQLQAYVLLPKDANIHTVGGKGFEFFIDGMNYDNSGEIAAAAQRMKGAEVGAWRVEVSPGREAAEDVFLTVLLPSALGQKPTHRVRLLEEAGRTGCEIIGPSRTTRWWFDAQHKGMRIELHQGKLKKTFDATLVSNDVPSKRTESLWTKLIHQFGTPSHR